jgi:hypothetical protein
MLQPNRNFMDASLSSNSLKMTQTEPPKKESMLIIKLLVNEKLNDAEFALSRANSETLVEICQKYLSALTQYCDDLYQYRGTQEMNLHPASALLKELVEQTTTVIRAEEENILRKRTQTEALLSSFTNITEYEAVQTFNQLEYKGRNDWELRANEVRLKDDANNEKFSSPEAIKIAGELRRKAFVIYKTTFID